MPPPKPPTPGGCEGGDEDGSCPSPPTPPSSHGHRRLVVALVSAASVLFVVLLVCSIYCFIRRRRRQRLRREALLVSAPAAGGGDPPTVPAADVNGADGLGVGAGDDQEEVLHHAWHIRTVGLDEAAIESIALTRYRAAAGMLGATDCSVCLSEFRDGELLRLLPKCGHAFHVPCIDTWLRAHVNCPLCRADILHPASADDDDGEPVPAASDRAGTATDQASTNNDETTEHELRIEIDRRDQSSSPEPPHLQNFRRVASMNSPPVSAEEATEDEHDSKGKQGNGDSASCMVSSGGSRRLPVMRRSFSGGGRRCLVSRHGCTGSSMLPL
ncbi:hypothetical protein GUJ93_ZPchr0006g43997 [Zizania palustris]|uniref:RING-type E3 ubiquitin transferase n=1 Tax=Zizania palustris TaxID=103762 RepID=A0A8J5T065_ZIZPA|nr:hypothetical protein GUJ93_ZPchr0006g43997 [Zizania palustris]